MTRYTLPLLFAIGALFGTSSPVAAGEDPGARSGKIGAGVAVRTDGTRITIEVDWREYLQADLAADARDFSIEKFNVPKNSIVTIHHRHFNFINYKVKQLKSVEVVEAAQAVESLWKELFGLSSILQPGGGFFGVSRQDEEAQQEVLEIKNFYTALRLWRLSLRTTKTSVGTASNAFADSIALSETELEDVTGSVTGFVQKLSDLSEQRVETESELAKASSALLTNPAGYFMLERAFNDLERDHEAVSRTIRAYIRSARLTLRGSSQRVNEIDKTTGKESVIVSGQIVTDSLIPVLISDQGETEQTEQLTLTFYVRSDLPFLMHIGFAFSSLKQASFEKVRSLEQRDFFAIDQNETGTGDLALFLSYEFHRWGQNDKHGVAGTLGTLYSSPDTSILAGISGRFFSRFLVTAGVQSLDVIQGASPFVERLGEELETRTLFGTFFSKRQWEPFVGLSIRLF